MLSNVKINMKINISVENLMINTGITGAPLGFEIDGFETFKYCNIRINF